MVKFGGRKVIRSIIWNGGGTTYTKSILLGTPGSVFSSTCPSLTLCSLDTYTYIYT